MNFFEQFESKEKKEKFAKSIEIFSRKKGRSSKRYGSKRPIEDVKKDQLVAWREDL
jgi:hypothetical protein